MRCSTEANFSTANKNKMSHWKKFHSKIKQKSYPVQFGRAGRQSLKEHLHTRNAESPVTNGLAV